MSMHWPNFPRSGAQVPYGTFMTPLGLLPAYMGDRIAALVFIKYMHFLLHSIVCPPVFSGAVSGKAGVVWRYLESSLGQEMAKESRWPHWRCPLTQYRDITFRITLRIKH